jgi:cytochrome P450
MTMAMYALDPRFRRIPGTSAPQEIVALVQNPFRFLEERYHAHGPIFRSSLIYPVVWMIGPEANRFIMVNRREIFSYEGGYGQLAFGRLFPRNVLIMDGEEHLHMRGILEPAVSRLGLEESIEQVQALWHEAAARLRREGPVDAYHTAQRTTFEVSARALTGLTDTSELEDMRPLFEAVIDGSMATTKIRWPGGLLDKALDARDELVKRLTPHVERARRGDARGFLARLAQHQEDGRYLPIDEVVSHVMLLFWAGYDTTASAGSWILHLLAHHPEWQDRIRREAFEVLGDAPYQLAGSGKLVSLSMFLREIERYAPSLIMFPRKVTEGFEFGGHFVPAGATVYYSPWMTHRCPETFPHPHTFDPGRWDPARGEDQAKGKYMVGFGGGPRLCLGRQFAQMQLRILITTLVRRFHIEPDATSSVRIMGLPVHHPVDSRLRFREPLDYHKKAALEGAAA